MGTTLSVSTVLYSVGAGLGNQAMAWPAYCALRERHERVLVRHAQGDWRAQYTSVIFPDVVPPGTMPKDVERVYTSQHGGKKAGFLEWDGTSSEIEMNLRMIGCAEARRHPWRSQVGIADAGAFDVVFAPRSSEVRKDYSEWHEVTEILRERGDVSMATVDQKGPPIQHTVDRTGVGLPETIGLLARAGCVVANDSGLFHVANLIGVPNLVISLGNTSLQKNLDPRVYTSARALVQPDPEGVVAAILEMLKL